jgi:hypothetical protein
MLNNALDTKPWYREPWPWMLMSLPLAAVVASFVTLSFALHTEDGLVANDYYKEGLAINRQLQREQKATDLGLHAEALVEGNGLLRVHLTSRGTLPAALALRLVHPTRAGMDQSVRLTAAPGGWYEGRLQRPQPAHWQVVLEDVGGNWRLAGRWDVAANRGIEFPGH